MAKTYQMFCQAFQLRRYEEAAEIGVKLAQSGFLPALLDVFGLAGAAFRMGRSDLCKLLTDAMLSRHPSWRPALELREKNEGTDATYRTTENPVVPLVQTIAYQQFAGICAGSSVLEVGCGTGLGTSILAKAGAKVYATDIEDSCLEYARKKYNAAVEYKQCSGTDLPYPDGAFDYVVSIDVIEHIPDFHKALDEMRRVCRKAVLISTPNRLPENTNPDGTPRNYWHQFEWSPEEISEVFNQHFPAVSLDYVCGQDNNMWFAEGKSAGSNKKQALVATGWIKPPSKISSTAAEAPQKPIRKRAKTSSGKTTLHFIYSGNPENDQSVRAPETIANHLYRHFSKLYPVRYYDWLHTGQVDIGPDDVILGHPYYDERTLVQRLFKTVECRAKCLIFPFHHALPRINLPFDPLVRECDRVFSITGQYWYDTLPASPFAHWGTKMVRLDMAVDAQRFPFSKTRFNPPGKRTLFYLGSDLPEKGVNKLAEFVRHAQCKLIYAGSLQASKSLFAGLDLEYWGTIELTPDRIKQICESSDFFVNYSVSDANPTTILEMAAIGLPVLATPQSGYVRPDLVYPLSLCNPVESLATLNALQEASEETLLDRARKARSIVENEYTWARFCQTVEKELAALL